MKVFQPGTRGVRTTFVQPGAKFPNSDFLDEQGKPKMFSVRFIEGCADVPDNLAAYMIDAGLAQRSPLILPSA